MADILEMDEEERRRPWIEKRTWQKLRRPSGRRWKRVSAKVDYNSETQVAYDVSKYDIDCFYLASVTCKKCEWSGDESELEEL